MTARKVRLVHPAAALRYTTEKWIPEEADSKNIDGSELTRAAAGDAPASLSVAEGTAGREQQAQPREPVRGELASVDREPGLYPDDHAPRPFGRDQ